jgi:DNA-directed RNA polymerase subunit P
MYRCFGCGKDISEEQLKGRIRCPYCGNRVLMKKRPEIPRKLKAI